MTRRLDGSRTRNPIRLRRWRRTTCTATWGTTLETSPTLPGLARLRPKGDNCGGDNNKIITIWCEEQQAWIKADRARYMQMLNGSSESVLKSRYATLMRLRQTTEGNCIYVQ